MTLLSTLMGCNISLLKSRLSLYGEITSLVTLWRRLNQLVNVSVVPMSPHWLTSNTSCPLMSQSFILLDYCLLSYLLIDSFTFQSSLSFVSSICGPTWMSLKIRGMSSKASFYIASLLCFTLLMLIARTHLPLNKLLMVTVLGRTQEILIKTCSSIQPLLPVVVSGFNVLFSPPLLMSCKGPKPSLPLMEQWLVSPKQKYSPRMASMESWLALLLALPCYPGWSPSICRSQVSSSIPWCALHIHSAIHPSSI